MNQSYVIACITQLNKDINKSNMIYYIINSADPTDHVYYDVAACDDYNDVAVNNDMMMTMLKMIIMILLLTMT